LTEQLSFVHIPSLRRDSGLPPFLFKQSNAKKIIDIGWALTL
jgi:hypothetical protein